MVSVSDNGAGLPADHRQGFGMLGMRERVLALGGSMTVASTKPGRDRGSHGSLRGPPAQAIPADISLSLGRRDFFPMARPNFPDVGHAAIT